jgi:hypothetical protein
MSTLTKRLREAADLAPPCGYEDVMLEAADELERFRNALREILSRTFDQRAAEIARIALCPQTKD